VAFERLRDLGQHLSGAQALASALLAGMVAAVLVVAHQVMDSLAEGHLLAIWIGAWLVGFAALAALAQPARQLAAVLRQLTRPGAQRATGEAAR
jgi:Flp pilus assembly protein TadB